MRFRSNRDSYPQCKEDEVFRHFSLDPYCFVNSRVTSPLTNVLGRRGTRLVKSRISPSKRDRLASSHIALSKRDRSALIESYSALVYSAVHRVPLVPVCVASDYIRFNER